MPGFALQTASAARAFRIAPQDSNYFAVLFDPAAHATGNVFVVEIFRAGGATPPNVHQRAEEFFYVLHGEGVAVCDGQEAPLRQGDALLLRPGHEHVIRNTGAGKLYTMTVMTPNEGFAELILAGEPVELDAEDRAVLGG